MKKQLLLLLFCLASLTQAQQPQNVLIYQNNIPLLVQDEFDPIFEQLITLTKTQNQQKKQQIIEHAIEIAGWIKLVETYIKDNNITPTPVSKCVGIMLEKATKQLKVPLSSTHFQQTASMVVSILQQIHNQYFTLYPLFRAYEHGEMERWYQKLESHVGSQNMPSYEEMQWLLSLIYAYENSAEIKQLVTDYLKKTRIELQQRYRVVINNDLVDELYLKKISNNE
jgi:hypothetical protein